MNIWIGRKFRVKQHSNEKWCTGFVKECFDGRWYGKVQYSTYPDVDLISDMLNCKVCDLTWLDHATIEEEIMDIILNEKALNMLEHPKLLEKLKCL